MKLKPPPTHFSPTNNYLNTTVKINRLFRKESEGEGEEGGRERIYDYIFSLLLSTKSII